MNVIAATRAEGLPERRLALLRELEKQAALALGVDDPPRQPRPPEPRRAEGGRPPGVLRLGDLGHGGAVFRDRCARRTGSRSSRMPARCSTPSTPCSGARAARSWPRLRQFGGAQSYPSRVKDGAEVDFSTGSVGLGVAMTTFSRADAGLCAPARAWRAPTCRRAATSPSPATPSWTRATSTRRCWRAGSTTSATSGGSSTTTAKALTAFVPDRLFGRIEGLFRDMGWNVVTMKYGRKLQAAFAREGGEALRRWIDDCPNSLYSALTFQGGAAWRQAVLADLGRSRACARSSIRCRTTNSAR